MTATRRLPLLDDGPPTPEDVARAYWAAHHARHDPAMVGEPAAAAEKSGLLAAIAAAPRHSRERRERFNELHALLDRVDRSRANELAALAQRAHDAERRHADWAIASDRTWPFPLYPEAVLRDLRHRIEAAFSG